MNAEEMGRFDTVLKKIVRKYCPEPSLYEDCEQEARITLLSLDPKAADPRKWDAYCRNAIRNSVLSHLSSLRTGSWMVGRRNKDGTYRHPLESLDDMVEYGVQVREDGLVVWSHGRKTWPHFSNTATEADNRVERTNFIKHALCLT